jgi:predicted nucleic acid-binding protein
MIVVADTSPLNYLIQIGCESLLPVLYTRVMIPGSGRQGCKSRR